MALIITKPTPPEMVGISPEAAKAIEAVRGKLELPDSQMYVRIGAIVSLKPRHLLVQFEFWASQEVARERAGKPAKVIDVYIAPEPIVMQRERTDSTGNVIIPAIVTPTYDHLMSTQVTGKVANLDDAYNALRAGLTGWAKTWGEFVGATDA